MPSHTPASTNHLRNAAAPALAVGRAVLSVTSDAAAALNGVRNLTGAGGSGTASNSSSFTSGSSGNSGSGNSGHSSGTKVEIKSASEAMLWAPNGTLVKLAAIGTAAACEQHSSLAHSAFAPVAPGNATGTSGNEIGATPLQRTPPPPQMPGDPPVIDADNGNGGSDSDHQELRSALFQYMEHDMTADRVGAVDEMIHRVILKVPRYQHACRHCMRDILTPVANAAAASGSGSPPVRSSPAKKRSVVGSDQPPSTSGLGGSSMVSAATHPMDDTDRTGARRSTSLSHAVAAAQRDGAAYAAAHSLAASTLPAAATTVNASMIDDASTSPLTTGSTAMEFTPSSSSPSSSASSSSSSSAATTPVKKELSDKKKAQLAAMAAGRARIAQQQANRAAAAIAGKAAKKAAAEAAAAAATVAGSAASALAPLATTAATPTGRRRRTAAGSPVADPTAQPAPVAPTSAAGSAPSAPAATAASASASATPRSSQRIARLHGVTPATTDARPAGSPPSGGRATGSGSESGGRSGSGDGNGSGGDGHGSESWRAEIITPSFRILDDTELLAEAADDSDTEEDMTDPNYFSKHMRALDEQRRHYKELMEKRQKAMRQRKPTTRADLKKEAEMKRLNQRAVNAANQAIAAGRQLALVGPGGALIHDPATIGAALLSGNIALYSSSNAAAFNPAILPPAPPPPPPPPPQPPTPSRPIASPSSRLQTVMPPNLAVPLGLPLLPAPPLPPGVTMIGGAPVTTATALGPPALGRQPSPPLLVPLIPAPAGLGLMSPARSASASDALRAAASSPPPSPHVKLEGLANAAPIPPRTPTPTPGVGVGPVSALAVVIPPGESSASPTPLASPLISVTTTTAAATASIPSTPVMPSRSPSLSLTDADFAAQPPQTPHNGGFATPYVGGSMGEARFARYASFSTPAASPHGLGSGLFGSAPTSSGVGFGTSSSASASSSSSSSSSSASAMAKKAREKKIPPDVYRRPRFNSPSHSKDLRVATFDAERLDHSFDAEASEAAAEFAAGYDPPPANTTTADGLVTAWYWRRPTEYIRVIGDDPIVDLNKPKKQVDRERRERDQLLRELREKAKVAFVEVRERNKLRSEQAAADAAAIAAGARRKADGTLDRRGRVSKRKRDETPTPIKKEATASASAATAAATSAASPAAPKPPKEKPAPGASTAGLSGAAAAAAQLLAFPRRVRPTLQDLRRPQDVTLEYAVAHLRALHYREGQLLDHQRALASRPPTSATGGPLFMDPVATARALAGLPPLTSTAASPASRS